MLYTVFSVLLFYTCTVLINLINTKYYRLDNTSGLTALDEIHDHYMIIESNIEEPE